MEKKNENNEVAVVPTSPANLLELAITNGADIDKLQGLMDLQERWDKKQAEKAYYNSLALFQFNCPQIIKTKAGYDKRYYYAPLDQIIKVIKASLFEAKLTYRWKQSEKNNKISVTCIITHVDGHSESTTLESDPDTSGSKNQIQSKGSTVQYLRRYTLESVLGIATSSIDNDGQQPKVVAPKKESSAKLLEEAKVKVDAYKDPSKLQKEGTPLVQGLKARGLTSAHQTTLTNHILRKYNSLKPE